MRHAPPADLTIRWRMDGDETALYKIDQRANRLFIVHGMPHVAENSWPYEVFADFIRAHQCLVAEVAGVKAGYVAMGEEAGTFWIKELAVDPEFHRQGIGSALVAAAVEQAQWAFHNAICLTTFRDLPFNAPFYARNGFMNADVDKASPEIRKILESETPHGASVAERVLMIRRL